MHIIYAFMNMYTHACKRHTHSTCIHIHIHMALANALPVHTLSYSNTEPGIVFMSAGYRLSPPPTLPSRIQPLNTEGAVGVMRRVANMRVSGLRGGQPTLMSEYFPRSRILEGRVGGGE